MRPSRKSSAAPYLSIFTVGDCVLKPSVTVTFCLLWKQHRPVTLRFKESHFAHHQHRSSMQAKILSKSSMFWYQTSLRHIPQENTLQKIVYINWMWLKIRRRAGVTTLNLPSFFICTKLQSRDSPVTFSHECYIFTADQKRTVIFVVTE